LALSTAVSPHASQCGSALVRPTPFLLEGIPDLIILEVWFQQHPRLEDLSRWLIECVTQIDEHCVVRHRMGGGGRHNGFHLIPIPDELRDVLWQPREAGLLQVTPDFSLDGVHWRKCNVASCSSAHHIHIGGGGQRGILALMAEPVCLDSPKWPPAILLAKQIVALEVSISGWWLAGTLTLLVSRCLCLRWQRVGVGSGDG
jgi:hypothetical protein